MSNVIKLQNNSRKIQLKVASGVEELYSDFNSDEERLAEKLKKEFDNGYQTAVNDLEKKYAEKYEKQISEEKKYLTDLISKINDEMEHYEAKFSEMVITVALSMSKKILKQEIEKNSPLIENINSIAQKMIGANYLVIKTNPEELQLLKENSHNAFAEGNYSKIKFEEDPRIEKGGFIIESDIGNIDGQISSQLNEIKKAIGNLPSVEE
ncbi:MAG: FliH/SctL family protein [Melioribacteraceae bacterium]|nr:MAG: FliH/SctL family protein [Melioribacteraceae bacterium]